MTGKKVGERLTSPRLQPVAKPVKAWTGFADLAKVKDDPSLQDELDDLIEMIERGDEVPERFYQRSVGGDRLLNDHGIMHIHLQHPGSDVIVYLVQYEDEVQLIGTGTHAELTAHYWRRRGAFHISADAGASLRAKLAAKRRQAFEARKKERVQAALADLKKRTRKPDPEPDS